jgi:hypothetical protein
LEKINPYEKSEKKFRAKNSAQKKWIVRKRICIKKINSTRKKIIYMKKRNFFWAKDKNPHKKNQILGPNVGSTGPLYRTLKKTGRFYKWRTTRFIWLHKSKFRERKFYARIMSEKKLFCAKRKNLTLKKWNWTKKKFCAKENLPRKNKFAKKKNKFTRKKFFGKK